MLVISRFLILCTFSLSPRPIVTTLRAERRLELLIHSASQHFLRKRIHIHVHLGSPVRLRSLRKPILCNLRLGMRHINRKALRQNSVLVSQQSEMRDPLHLVLSIVHKSLVELRQFLTSLHHNVRLLNVVLHASHVRHIGGRRKSIPLIKMVWMRSRSDSETIA